MKKVIMVVIGSLLFVAGYNYTRRQAEYAASQSTLVKPTLTKTPVILPFKVLPTFVLQTDRSF
jgi:hypothetical protein